MKFIAIVILVLSIAVLVGVVSFGFIDIHIAHTPVIIDVSDKVLAKL